LYISRVNKKYYHIKIYVVHTDYFHSTYYKLSRWLIYFYIQLLYFSCCEFCTENENVELINSSIIIFKSFYYKEVFPILNVCDFTLLLSYLLIYNIILICCAASDQWYDVSCILSSELTGLKKLLKKIITIILLYYYNHF